VGSKKKKQPKPTLYQEPDTTALQNQYQKQLESIQQQNQQVLGQIQEANQGTIGALNTRVAEAERINQTYQQQLQTYLSNLQQLQTENQANLQERDALQKQLEEIQKNQLSAANLANNLNTSNQIASRAFEAKTSRGRGGFLG
jgi:uncharacterized coiled-coil protein SlyX